MSDHAEVAASAATKIAIVANKFQWFGSGGAILGGLSIQEVGVFAGVLIAFSGFCVNWYYKHKAHELKVEWYRINVPSEISPKEDV
jgi:hypothetical protein